MSSSVWPVVHAERRALVDDLAGLESAEWETPSLCDGWAVRDVVAHLAATAALRSAVDYVASPPLPVITRLIEIVVHAVTYLFGDRPSGGKQRLKGLALTATDADFSIGDGALVKGPAVALLLAASGRSALLDQLSGPGSRLLTNRLP